jgi:hypothetical protein
MTERTSDIKLTDKVNHKSDRNQPFFLLLQVYEMIELSTLEYKEFGNE